MNEAQREAAERLINEYIAYDEVLDWPAEAAALLRELLAAPVVNPQMTTELAEPVQEPKEWPYNDDPA